MIGKIITDLLLDNADLLALVDRNNIYPYVANEKTSLPLIIYTIDKVDSTYTKDGWANDIVDFSVMSFSEDYKALQAIVAEVRDALELESSTGTLAIRLTGMVEGYNLTENCFQNRLLFRIQINNY